MTWYFQYGVTTSYGSTTTATGVPAGGSVVAESASLTGLSAGTTYDFRFVVISARGTADGANLTFTTVSTTPPGTPPTTTSAPSASTMPATSVSSSGATLDGSVNPNGLATTYYFEYGTSTSYGSTTTSSSAGSGTAAAAESAGLSGLSASTTYDFQLVATNADGTSDGGNVTFTTSSSTVTPPPTPTLYYETTGGVTNTWSDYGDAGGTEGPQIAKNATVQVNCRISGWKAPDGNTWWYQIPASPWNNAYFASADAFYNNGATSGSLVGTPWYDPSVPVC